MRINDEERPTSGIRGVGYGQRKNRKKIWWLLDYTEDDDERKEKNKKKKIGISGRKEFRDSFLSQQGFQIKAKILSFFYK